MDLFIEVIGTTLFTLSPFIFAATSTAIIDAFRKVD